MLSSSARIDKSKRRKTQRQRQEEQQNATNPMTGSSSSSSVSSSIPIIHPHVHKHDDSSDSNSSDDDSDDSTASDDSDDDDDDDDDENFDKKQSNKRSHQKTTKKKKKTKRHSDRKIKQIHQEEVAAFRNKLRIYLSKSNRHDVSIPDPITSFGDMVCPSWWSAAAAAAASGTQDSGGKVEEDTVFRSLRTTIVRNIENGRWINPTPIQMQSIPSLLERRDVLGCAPTGSGKSGAFIIPSLFLSSVDDSLFYNTTTTAKDSTNNNNNNGKIRALLLAPSRELASQLHREVERLGVGKFRGLKSALLSKSNAGTLCAASNNTTTNSNGKSSSTSTTGRGLDILVSTPLRLVECLEKGDEKGGGKKLDLGSVRIVVLDEADRLLDASDGSDAARNRHSNDNNNNDTEGGDAQPQQSRIKTFLAQIDTILSNIPPTATRALFSATIGSSIRSLSESILRNQIDVSIGSQRVKGNNNATAASGISDGISQSLQFVGKEEGKLLAIRQIVAGGLHPPAIIFLQSKERAQALYLELMYDEGMKVDVVHGGMSQASRETAVGRFRGGETWVLICTDLCARGMDFKAVNMVINYDLPTSGVTYVHRIGRCGRAGRKGVAVTLFTEVDFGHLRGIANVMKLSGCDVPDWMLSLKNDRGYVGGGGGRGNGGGGRRIRGNGKMPIKRQSIDTTPKYDRVKRNKRKQFVQHSKEAKKE